MAQTHINKSGVIGVAQDGTELTISDITNNGWTTISSSTANVSPTHATFTTFTTPTKEEQKSNELKSMAKYVQDEYKNCDEVANKALDGDPLARIILGYFHDWEVKKTMDKKSEEKKDDKDTDGN